MTRSLLFSFCLLVALDVSAAQTAWQPAPGHTQIPIWPAAMPDPQLVDGQEVVSAVKQDEFVAGRSWQWIEKVAVPTLTVYPPKVANTGVALVVFPGGGYQGLAIDLEGTEVCDWVTAKGITCVVLKYRVPTPRLGAYYESRQALEDAQRTLGLVRSHAAEWHIDPHKIGVVGFSAGGDMVAEVSTNFEKRSYSPVDAADQESSRPDFAMALYPGHLWIDDKGFVLNPNITVTAHTPPTFLAQSENDPVDDVNNSLVYFLALKSAGVPVEMHLFAKGGHGFGLRRTTLPISGWPQLAETWLHTIGMLAE